VRAGDTIARLGGDEFAILLEDMAAADEEGEQVIARIGDSLRRPFFVDGKDVVISASIGITVSTPDRVEGADELLRNADVAMYSAKERGNGRSATFEPSMHKAALERLEMEADLRRAVERQEFQAYYQPLIDLATGTMTGVEALIRWRHPTRGLVPPLEFIPLAEDTGLILPIGRWILREACQQARKWQLLYPDRKPLVVNVNLSARQLQEPGLVEDVAQALAETGLPPHTLVLEITESVLMHDAEATVGWLRELSALGVQLAIDDFGTGYSSLSYLRQFPVNTLKIDKSFVDGVRLGSEQSTLASAIIELGRKLGLKTVAEGIEQADQLAELGALGCDVGQGYLFARPLDSDALEALLAERNADSASGEAWSTELRAA
jgi:EAL domain-containing protein (putative c-di-GMP-specific phosphodiesterase class I)